MKKIILFILFIISIQDLFSIINDSMETNQYVYYHYNVGKFNAYIGLIYLDNNNYCLRIINKNNNKEILMMLTIDKKNNKFELNPTNAKVLDDFESKELSMIIIALFNNILLQYVKIDFSKFPNNIIINEKIDQDFEYKFSYWIPLTNLYSFKNLTENVIALKLIKFGIIANVDDFLKFNEIPQTSENGPDLKLVDKKPKLIKYFKTELLIDENWIEVNEKDSPLYKNKTYIIKIKTDREAQINFENTTQYNLSLAAEDLIKNTMSLFQQDSYIYPDSVEIKYINKNLFAFYKVLDFPTNTNNYAIIMTKKNNDKDLTVVNFSCYNSVYENNKEYFNKIIFSLK